MAKAKDAFRTISEVAEWLDTPTHVLRFWETKFSQIRPVKGAGSRRYYRPADMELLGGIKQLLHEDGMTIKGAQKMLREQGAKHVSTLGKSLKKNEAETTLPEPVTTVAPAPVVAPAPAPAPLISIVPEPIQSALPFDPAPTPPKADPAHIDIPELPNNSPILSARLVGYHLADRAILRSRAAQIAPLLARLEQLRAQMRAQ